MRRVLWLCAISLTLLCALAATRRVVAVSAARNVPSRPATSSRSASAPPVRRGTLIAADVSGRVMVLDRAGSVVRRIPGSFGAAHQVQAIQLAPDRRHAYVAVYGQSGSLTLYLLELSTGRRRKVAAGFSPALNPAGTKLAYVSLIARADTIYERALVIQDLRSHRDEAIPFPAGVVPGTPPELVLNWSPDGRRIAVFDGRVIRLVDVAAATSVGTEPAPPGDANGLMAPVFLDSRTLVTLANCCIGRQRLTAIDLRSGARRAFARLSSPPENIWRLRTGTLLVQDALTQLVLVSRGHARVIATKFAAAAPA